jgi:hypothetical protein
MGRRGRRSAGQNRGGDAEDEPAANHSRMLAQSASWANAPLDGGGLVFRDIGPLRPVDGPRSNARLDRSASLTGA